MKSLIASAPAIDLRANVARNWSRVDAVPGPNNRLDQQTPLSANVGFDVHGDTMSTGASLNFTGAGTVRVAGNQVVYLHARRDLELYALWKPDPAYQVRIAALNLLGQDMVDERSYASVDTGSLLRNRIVNVAHPSLRLSLEHRF